MPAAVKSTGAAPAGNATDRTIDLDKARKARAETQGEPVTLRFGGENFELAPECSADFALYASEGNLRAAVAALIGEEAGKFFALKPSMEDIGELCAAAGRVYGLDEGESAASPTS